MRRAPRFGLAALVSTLVFALALAACASAPVVRLHTLVAATDAPAPAATASVTLRVGAVPVQVDQPQWLVRLPDDTLLLLEQERWAAPLREELRAGLQQALALRAGVADGGPSARRLTLEVTRLESRPGREALIDANWSLAPADAASPLLACQSALREPVGAGAPALAEGHRRNLAALAVAIGQALRTGRCPG